MISDSVLHHKIYQNTTATPTIMPSLSSLPYELQYKIFNEVKYECALYRSVGDPYSTFFNLIYINPCFRNLVLNLYFDTDTTKWRKKKRRKGLTLYRLKEAESVSISLMSRLTEKERVVVEGGDRKTTKKIVRQIEGFKRHPDVMEEIAYQLRREVLSESRWKLREDAWHREHVCGRWCG